MKVRMSYEIDIDRIPYEMNKTKEEIVALLGSVIDRIVATEVTDVAKSAASREALVNGQRDLAQANDKIVSLSQYVDNNKQISDKLKDEEIEARAQEIVEERTSIIKEELEKAINDRTEEFNALIKERENVILQLQGQLKQAEKPAPKKKSPRKKRSSS
jgi:hypothetical protein